jgi:ABC-type multidrug transport system ATPase subunit
MEKPPIVECVNVTWNPKRCRILPPIRFSMGRELVVLQGGGYGKRVFLEIIAGRERAYTGTVQVLGEKVSSQTLIEKVALYVAGLKLPEYWTSRECLSFLAGEKSTEDLQEWAKAAGLALDVPLGKLTSADRAICGVACALSKKAELYLLYEPFAGLDESVSRELFDILTKKVEGGAAVLVGSATIPLLTDSGVRIFNLSK